MCFAFDTPSAQGMFALIAYWFRNGRTLFAQLLNDGLNADGMSWLNPVRPPAQVTFNQVPLPGSRHYVGG